MNRTGLFFGSFNPIHLGHLEVAQQALSTGLVTEVWFVVSPQNPLKSEADLAPEQHRLAMAELAVRGNTALAVCDEECHLPRPSFTADTLKHLFALYPEKTFTMIIGDDLTAQMHRWKEYVWIMEHVSFLIYPRRFEQPAENLPAFWPRERTRILNAARMPVSSTEVRNRCATGNSISNLVPPGVEEYIVAHGIYGAGEK